MMIASIGSLPNNMNISYKGTMTDTMTEWTFDYIKAGAEQQMRKLTNQANKQEKIVDKNALLAIVNKAKKINDKLKTCMEKLPDNVMLDKTIDNNGLIEWFLEYTINEKEPKEIFNIWFARYEENEDFDSIKNTMKRLTSRLTKNNIYPKLINKLKEIIMLKMARYSSTTEIDKASFQIYFDELLKLSKGKETKDYIKTTKNKIAEHNMQVPINIENIKRQIEIKDKNNKIMNECFELLKEL